MKWEQCMCVFLSVLHSQEYLDKKLYTNKPSGDYFNQFNTTSRWLQQLTRLHPPLSIPIVLQQIKGVFLSCKSEVYFIYFWGL